MGTANAKNTVEAQNYGRVRQFLDSRFLPKITLTDAPYDWLHRNGRGDGSAVSLPKITL